MRTAVLIEAHKPLGVLDLEQDGPKAAAARVEVNSRGACLSDVPAAWS